MMMQSMQDYIPDILGARGIVGCPPEIALDALRKTAIDFCNQSSIWTFHGQFLSQTNVKDYPIDVPEDARLASMEWVAVDGYPIKANPQIVPTPFMSAMNPNSFYMTWGAGFSMEGRDFVWLSPTPQTNDKHITFSAALKPTQQACQLPDWLYQDWLDALTAGTASRLFMIPKQDFSNSGLAIASQREYSRGIARARQVKAQNFSQAPMRMTGSYF